jgi:hypothetical protein
MAGNRKHGFMRGNKAGRNGVGSPKGFYCDVCKKQHGATVERTEYQGKLMCDRQYFKLEEAEFTRQKKLQLQLV